MKQKRSLLVAIAAVLLSMTALGQSQSLVKRTTTKTDTFPFGSGGTVQITGAPNGSIKVTGHAKNEIEIVAEIEVQAGNEADLAKLAEATGFVTDETAIRTTLITVGGHNKFGLKKLPKNLSKQLLGLPFTINYTISVPRYSDLEIDGGKGDLSISNVEGSIRVNFLESNANIEVIGGNTLFMLGAGTLDVKFNSRGWRGRYCDIQVASGDMSVHLPSNLSADLDASVLKTGGIENLIPDLKPRDRKVPFTERSILAKAGVGGATMKFVVGSGKLKLERLN